MKSLYLKSKTSDRKINKKRLNSLNTSKHIEVPTSKNCCEESTKKADTTQWEPTRDWHKYLGGGEKPSPSPTTICLHNPTTSDSSVSSLVPPSLLLPLPKVHFCSPRSDQEPSPRGEAPGITDLCDEDKKKIANLVKELARCKQDKAEDDETIINLKTKVSDLRQTVKRFQMKKKSEQESMTGIQKQHIQEQKALKNQLDELQQLLHKMQLQKAESEAQVKRISSQAQKLTSAVHAMHRENTDLRQELGITKERLKTAQEAVERMSTDLKSVQEQIKPPLEDKACQSCEDLLTDTGYVKTINIPASEKYEDHQLLSELFFNKSFLDNMTPKETIIIIPADLKNKL